MEIRFHVITNHSLKLYCLDSTGRSSEEGGEGFLLSDLLVLGSLPVDQSVLSHRRARLNKSRAL
jgi:hypothetical protein